MRSVREEHGRTPHLTYGFKPSGFRGLMFGLAALLGDAFVVVDSGTSDFTGVADELKAHKCQYWNGLRSRRRSRLT